jgi:hypothetical protein
VTLFGPLLGESGPPPEVVTQLSSLRERLILLRPEPIPRNYAAILDLPRVQVADPQDKSASPGLLTMQSKLSFSDAGCVMAINGSDLSNRMHRIGQVCFFGKQLDSRVTGPRIEINFGAINDRSWHSCNVPPLLSVMIATLDAQPQVAPH